MLWGIIESQSVVTLLDALRSTKHLQMELKIYPLLSTRSKRAFVKETKEFGRPYRYEPRQRLVERLMTDLNMSESEVLKQIRKERAWILKNRKYFV